MPWQVWTVLLFTMYVFNKLAATGPRQPRPQRLSECGPRAFIPTTLSIEIRRLPLSPGGVPALPGTSSLPALIGVSARSSLR